MEGSGPSKFLYWLIGLLAVLVIAGVMSWLYLSGNNSSTASKTPTTTTTPAKSHDDVVVAGTDITNSLAGLDQDLATIDKDIASTDDQTPTL